MAAAPKFAQELAKKIQNTRGVLAAERTAVRTAMDGIAFDAAAPTGMARTTLLALQVAARDEQVWTALVAARASLKPPTTTTRARSARSTVARRKP